ncbi:hypothetical protein F5Y19DRAFT_364392 [Xylariaceae sp. FL1651]|nr:hypothetical protein F5Y19DRAFT_364392 [Xylariaceae sp. FL1651]
MAMWPFRRKGSRRRSRTAPIDSSDLEASGRGRRPPRTQTEPASAANASDLEDENRAQEAPHKLQRRSRAYSFSPGRQDSLRVAKLRKQSVLQGYGSITSDDVAMRVPTLHHDNSRNKRRGQPLPRKKSSKRRKEDHDREAEIKAMSLFMPVRPATDSWTAGRPMKRESRQFRIGLSGAVDNPSSDISLPLPESIHSAMSSDSEHVSWKVSAFDALAPRPTLRYASNPIMSPASHSGPVRSQSARRKISERTAIPESTLRAHRRIHDLADDLDASDLRELMERDKRRRERKMEKDRERVERRLARRAEKQRAEEAAALRSGSPPPANLERGVLGREMPQSVDNRTSAIVTSSRRRSPSDSPRRRSRQSSQLEELGNREKTPSPLDEFYRTDSIPPEPSRIEVPESTAAHEQVESSPRRSPSPRIFSFIRSKKSRSKSPTQPDQAAPAGIRPPPATSFKLDDAESVSRTSDSRSSRPWMSLFKWGKARRSSGPSSFSNTSRDSMLVSQPTPPTSYMPPRKASSGVPKRTMSRFREDLPELPISPPDSRMASPEVEPIPVEPLPVIPDDVVMRYDTPIEARQSQDAMRATPISLHRDEVQPSPAPHSMSLASIDSEASWLSGRISRKRTSSGMRTSLQYPPRAVSGLSGGSEGHASEHTDDDNIADDEYLNSVVPARLRRLSTGEARPSSDEEEAESSPKWGAVGQTPTVMHHRETMRSREGLLQSFDDEKEFGNAKESEDEGDGQSPVEPQRATSINLGRGHIRNFSAGSAKLLEISPRPSGEHRLNAMEQSTQ